MEENNEEEKESIDIEFTEQEADPEMKKIDFTLDDRMYRKKTRMILLLLTLLKILKQTDEEIFKKITG